MDDDLIQTLWEQFAVETDEHFSIIEPLLVDAEIQGSNDNDIAQLFRSFHTIKGLSKAMDMLSMEAVAHKAEDLLGLVRDKKAVLNTPLVSLLLDAVDALKSMRNVAVDNKQDSPRPEHLLHLLENAFKTASGEKPTAPPPKKVQTLAPKKETGSSVEEQDAITHPPVIPLHVVPPTPAIIPETPAIQQEVTEPFSVSTQAIVQLEQEAAPISLHDDPEMLQFFAELLKSNLVVIGNALIPEYYTDIDKYQDIVNATETLAHASEVMGYDHMRDTLLELKTLIPQATPVEEEAWEDLINVFTRFMAFVEHIETEAKLDTGKNTIAEALKDAIADGFHRLLDQIHLVISALENGHGEVLTEEDEQLAARITKLAASAYGYLIFLGFKSPSYLMLMLEDVYNRIVLGELYIFQEMLDLTREAIITAQRLFNRALHEGAHVVEGELPEVERLIQNFRTCIYAGGNKVHEEENSDLITVFRQFMSQVNIKPELVEILSPQNIQDLITAIKSGLHLFEIMAYLESSEELAMNFINWVEQVGSVITNRTVYIQEQSWFEFLIVSKFDEETLATQLKQINPDGLYLKLNSCNILDDQNHSGLPVATTETTLSHNVTSAPATTSNVSRTTSTSSTTKTASSQKRESHPSTENTSKAANSVIRVDGATLDQFMNQIGEMVLARSMLTHAVNDERAKNALTHLHAALERLRTETQINPTQQKIHAELEECLQHIEALEEQQHQLIQADLQLYSALGRLQERGMDLRVVPIDTVFKRFPRLVRDLAQSQGKQVRLELSGQEVRIDKGMVDVLVDPLIHMVRNSVDHGIEDPDTRVGQGKIAQATVSLTAMQRGNNVLVEVKDDGRGLDAKRILSKAIERNLVNSHEAEKLSEDDIFQFVFIPGFSTADKITETSGRGVGMDVVRSSVTRLGGDIKVTSEAGYGTTFTLQLPLSVAIQNTLLVEVNEQILAIPDRYVAEVFEAQRNDVQSVKGREAILLRNAFLPVVHLSYLLGRTRTQNISQSMAIVVLSNGRHRVGIEVDKMHRRQELFVKDIHPQLAALPGVGGASILGDGRVVLILDGEDLIRLAERTGGRNHIKALKTNPKN